MDVGIGGTALQSGRSSLCRPQFGVYVPGARECPERQVLGTQKIFFADVPRH